VSGLTLPDVFRVMLEHMEYSVEVERTGTWGGSGEVGFDAKVVRAKVGGQYSRATKRQLVVTSPTDTGLISLIQDAGLIVVMDEMHKASPSFRKELVDWIKATRTGPPSKFRLVLIGTSMDAERLVEPDPGIDRYVKEMSVDLMSHDEARFIIDVGFSRLGLSIENDLAERLVASAAGAPTIVQSLCLDAAESATNDGRGSISEDDCRTAVRNYLNDHGRRLAGHYLRAIETTGPKRYRRQILHAIASLNGDYATMDSIRTAVSQTLGEEVPSTSLSGPLRALKDQEYGHILQDVERVISGNRIHNLTTFTDPMMKSFVRFMGKLDETNLMPAPPELEDVSHELEQ
ncbi:hypothetical protein, partial [Geodermatophilus chilensis]|uniref:hypothetical protein n=1 Tax=Geodermatophilus chilensis TaxID=2035835 RepID=UPI001E2D0439